MVPETPQAGEAGSGDDRESPGAGPPARVPPDLVSHPDLIAEVEDRGIGL